MSDEHSTRAVSADGRWEVVFDPITQCWKCWEINQNLILRVYGWMREIVNHEPGLTAEAVLARWMEDQG